MNMSIAVASRAPDPKYSVLDIPLNAMTIPELVAQMERWIQNGDRGRCITFANVHVVMEAQKDFNFHKILTDERVFNVPDGMPLIWLGRLRGFNLKRRLYGPDVMQAFCEVAARKGYRHFFYGGADGVPELVAENLSRELQGMKVAGTFSPPFRALTKEEDDEVVSIINDARPDVLWIGLGCPKQERWAYEHRSRLNVPIIASVGQAFDLYSGRASKAPTWMRNNGLEWLFRLITNPRRLWRRYLIYNSQFLFFLAREWIGS
jgi:N-acetylglucosaminyldiphosphoundecaprenol N-acetyl-beta-D-mannosaminyltransferase